MKQLLFYSDNSDIGLVLRLTLGLIMLPHGAQNLFGAFGGSGYEATLSYFTDTLKFPWLFGLAIILIEFCCSIFLLLGFSTRLSAILFMCIMFGAVMTTNYSNGLFMNWFGNQKGEGFEYHLLVIGICIGLMFTGSGRYSMDNVIFNRQR